MAINTPDTRPPPLPINKTCTYKTVGETCIPIDLYFPPASNADAITTDGGEAARHPIMLFIHGGGWIGANKSDYSRPLFVEFLTQGFVVAAMDYRLRPETELDEQLADVRDVESWLRESLALETRAHGVEVDGERIVVVGCSAGAHLALLTPQLWTAKPSAIFSMYGPTNLHHLPYLHRFAHLNISNWPCTPEVLAAGTRYDAPPTEIPIPTPGLPGDDYILPRSVLAIHLFSRGLIADFLVRGLVRDADGTLGLPEKGSASNEEIDAISPLHLAQHLTYPPVYQLFGTADDVFDTSHAHLFHAALDAQAIPIATTLVPNVKHAFDSTAPVGGYVHRAYFVPAVEWLAAFV
ncbi:hypothetical protein LZ554_006631 [Drepanopeziza brunnea f. sp. 'monogermtubi']|nr:hypothetical protein LZ554_006631 [Drepanopeziza brunnea f. sp. 'monogermtubi']